jgi:hypothetical protein
MTAPVTLGACYFDALYQAAADPWGFEERWYEQRKYAISLAQLPAGRYRSAFGIVVPAHEEETLLPACLRALREATTG